MWRVGFGISGLVVVWMIGVIFSFVGGGEVVLATTSSVGEPIISEIERRQRKEGRKEQKISEGAEDIYSVSTRK